jgi:Zn-dependent peptidase ImmA (M78 family)
LAINPAILFFDNFQSNSRELQTLIESYVEFVLVGADANLFPVDLKKVFRQYQMEVLSAPLSGRGAVTEDLRILVNSSDKAEVQKYSQAHELMEIFISSIIECDPQCLSEKQITQLLDNKEQWCEIGASEFLMPRPLFTPLVHKSGISLQAAQSLAKAGGISLIATLRKMLKTNLRECAVILWYYGHKPTEKLKLQNGQLSFWDVTPPAKLRVHKTYSSKNIDFIRVHKSVETDSVIGQAYHLNNGVIVRGHSYLEVTSKPGNYLTEAMRIDYAGEDRVLSIIFFDEASET